jgi:hypothetical protein
MTALRNGLKEYKERADAQLALPEEKRPSLWDFWKASSLALTRWWAMAREVALIIPSSWTVERVFSLLAQGLGDNQLSALEDYIFASVMVRYNRIWTDKDAAKRGRE